MVAFQPIVLVVCITAISKGFVQKCNAFSLAGPSVCGWKAVDINTLVPMSFYWYKQKVDINLRLQSFTVV